MEFSEAVKSACRNALRDDECRIVITKWQIIYRRKETSEQFCRQARVLGYDARDDGGGTIVVYESG